MNNSNSSTAMRSETKNFNVDLWMEVFSSTRSINEKKLNNIITVQKTAK